MVTFGVGDGSGRATEVDLRSATHQDVDALAQLHLDTVSVAYRDFFPPEATMPTLDALGDLWSRDLDDAHAVVVAVERGAIVGSVVARVGGKVARLHVHPSRWRQGIGRRLHDTAVDALGRAGYEQISLWVIDRNVPARAMYERAGWRLDESEQLVDLGVVEVRYTLDL
jgi:GNAT superfamily N-acetyltransferase